MGVLSDRQIRKLCVEKGMVVPFEPGVKRPGVISYGLSSMGLDVRIGYKFRVFKSYPHDEIDPKNFNPSLLEEVDLTPKVCGCENGSADTGGIAPWGESISDRCPFCNGTENLKPNYIRIPPHSFALGESVETFDIPRDIMVVVLGKCLAGDSRVFYPLTGEYLPISQHRAEREVAAVKFIAADGDEVVPRKTSRLYPNGIREVFLLKTHSGAEIKATENHPFMVEGHDGGWKPLSEVRVGDKILRANYLPYFGQGEMPKDEVRLLAMMIADGQCSTPGSSPVYSKTDLRMIRLFKKCVASVLGCEVAHQKGGIGYRIVNQLGRGGHVTKNRATEWLESYGLDCKSAGKFVPASIMTAKRSLVRLFLRTLFSGDSAIYLQASRNGRRRTSVRFEYSSASRRLVQEVQHLLTRFGVNGTLREKKINGVSYWILFVFRKEDQARLFSEIGFVSGTAKAKFYEESVARYVSTDVSGDPPMTAWDQVVSIEEAGPDETFDIEVDQDHNFVAEGLVVHNSTYARTGLIVNVTPGEPGWKGKWTIEMSNTTPLPIRVYAGEGIMQCLFFRSDEHREGLHTAVRRSMDVMSRTNEVVHAAADAFDLIRAVERSAGCETSYADKAGKYQSQIGVTPPKVD